MLRRQDVGHRVVVRRFVGFRGDRRLFTDALGELVDVTETELTLATDKGTLVVPLEDVHRAKRVPPRRRPTAADVIGLELAADEAWPAPMHDRLGGWLLRAAEGWTGPGQLGAADRRPRPAAGGGARRGRAVVRRPRAAAPRQRADAAGRAGGRRPGRAGLDGPAAHARAERADGRPASKRSQRAPDPAAGGAERRVARDRRGAQAGPAGRRDARAHRRAPGPVRRGVRRCRAGRDRAGHGDRWRPLAAPGPGRDGAGTPPPGPGPRGRARRWPPGRRSSARGRCSCRSRSATRQRSRSTARWACRPTTPT